MKFLMLFPTKWHEPYLCIKNSQWHLKFTNMFQKPTIVPVKISKNVWQCKNC